MSQSEECLERRYYSAMQNKVRRTHPVSVGLSKVGWFLIVRTEANWQAGIQYVIIIYILNIKKISFRDWPVVN